MSENQKLRNIGARLAGCLFDFHGTCPECGNKRTGHMPNCAQVYEQEFKSPADCQRVFDKAFGFEVVSDDSDGCYPVKEFLEERCQRNSDATVSRVSLYRTFSLYCLEAGHRSVGCRQFHLMVGRCAPDLYRIQLGGSRLYKGLELMPSGNG